MTSKYQDLPEATRRRVKFAKTCMTDKTGQAWSDEGREWVVRDVWGALDGWKLWPGDPQRVCSGCMDRAGEIVYRQDDTEPADPDEHGPECDGLKTNRIKILMMDLDRRSGKTYNMAAFAMSDICRFKHRHAGFVASAGEQADFLVRQNVLDPIERSEYLSAVTQIRTSVSMVMVPGTGSSFRWYEHSDRSVTGGGLRLVIVDEAKDVSPEVLAKLIATAFEYYSWECPRGHYTRKEQGDGKCGIPGCKRELFEVTGQVVLMSSKGKLRGDPAKDWFSELCKQVDEEPDPEVHYFTNRTGRHLNPEVDKAGTREAVSRVLGKVAGLKASIAGETEDRWVDPSGDFVAHADLLRVTDLSLENRSASDAPCFGFLDTSRSGDLTSLILVEDDLDKRRAGEIEWSRVVLSRIRIWEPRELFGGRRSGNPVLDELEEVFTYFPKLVGLMVDLRGKMPWAEAMLKQVDEERRPWRRRIERLETTDHSGRDFGWTELEERILGDRIRMPNHPRIAQECRGVEWALRRDGTRFVKDKARHKTHREILESLALTLHRIQIHRVQSRRGLAEQRKQDSSSPTRKRIDAMFRRATAGLTPDSL